MVQKEVYYREVDTDWIAVFSSYSMISAMVMFAYLYFIGGNFIAMYRFFAYLAKPSKLLMGLVVFSLFCSFLANLIAGIDLSNYLLIGSTNLECKTDYILFMSLFIATRYAQYMFLVLRTHMAFKRTFVEMDQKWLYFFGTFAHFVVLFDVIALGLIFETASSKQAFAFQSETYFICTLSSYGNIYTFAVFGIFLAAFDAVFLIVMLIDFARRIKRSLDMAQSGEDIDILNAVFNRHLFVLFAAIFGSLFLIIGNFVYDQTDQFNFFQLIPLYYLFNNLIFMLSFEIRSTRVATMWPCFLLGCGRLPRRKYGVAANKDAVKGSAIGHSGTALAVGSDVTKDVPPIAILHSNRSSRSSVSSTGSSSSGDGIYSRSDRLGAGTSEHHSLVPGGSGHSSNGGTFDHLAVGARHHQDTSSLSEASGLYDSPAVYNDRNSHQAFKTYDTPGGHTPGRDGDGGLVTGGAIGGPIGGTVGGYDPNATLMNPNSNMWGNGNTLYHGANDASESAMNHFDEAGDEGQPSEDNLMGTTSYRPGEQDPLIP